MPTTGLNAYYLSGILRGTAVTTGCTIWPGTYIYKMHVLVINLQCYWLLKWWMCSPTQPMCVPSTSTVHTVWYFKVVVPPIDCGVLSHVHRRCTVCTARNRVLILQSVSLSVSLSVCGHKNEHFERIRNACGFLLQWMSSNLINNNLHTLHKQKSYEGLWRARFFHSLSK